MFLNYRLSLISFILNPITNQPQRRRRTHQPPPATTSRWSSSAFPVSLDSCNTFIHVVYLNSSPFRSFLFFSFDECLCACGRSSSSPFPWMFELYRAVCLWFLLDLLEETLKTRSFLYLCWIFCCNVPRNLSRWENFIVLVFCFGWEEEIVGSSIHETLFIRFDYANQSSFFFPRIWFA